MTRVCGNLFVAVLLCHYKCRSEELRKTQTQLWKFVSEAAPRFGNLCMYEPSALREKPYDSWKPSGLRRKLHCMQTHFGNVPNVGVIFWGHIHVRDAGTDPNCSAKIVLLAPLQSFRCAIIILLKLCHRRAQRDLDSVFL